jgi:hypothetical protein
MEAMFPWILLLHIAGAVVAFGPVFTFRLIGAMAAAEPMHANFALRVTRAISGRIVIPLAIFQGVTGLALIGIEQINPFERLWLLVAIVLYAVALTISLGFQTPLLKRMIEMTSTPPPPGATGGPPPEFLATAAKVRASGLILLALIVSIIFLMVVKPGS